ncbi:hypothetical protein [Sphaerisporangium fuscum]|uniref:hypothetical protein n=1 Tax=Sphaerisporangium fuscum TaxID=2835868 RepID=UPI001BDBCB47|nr:hypothetical protein [Sphaerisporangium fuscum]
MRISGGVLTCALVAVTAGCGTGAGLFGGAGGRVNLARAREALAKIDDPSAGLAEHSDDPWEPPFRPASPDCARLFDLAGTGRAEAGGTATVAASYRGGRLGETAAVVLAAYPGGDARHAVRTAAGLMRHCSVASGKAPGGGDRLVASELPMKALGEEVEARRFKGRVGGYPYEMHVVVMRSGDTLIALVHTCLARLAPERTQQLADVLAAKVREAAE